MKSNGFKTIYLLIAGIFILAIVGIYLNTKSENETKNSLTEKLTNPDSKISHKLQEVIAKNVEKKSEEMHEVKLDGSMLTKERIYTEDEINNMSPEQFNELLNDIERRLPKKTDIKKIPEQALHHTPPLIIEAGRNLGLIKEIIKVHNNYEKNALDFYQKCLNNIETPTTVRAICLTNLVVINQKNGTKYNTNKYPKEIVDLSKIVTDL